MAKKQLTRSKENRIIAGVCGGFAEYFDTDPTLVRALTVVIALVTAVFPMIIAYLILAIITPEN